MKKNISFDNLFLTEEQNSAFDKTLEPARWPHKGKAVGVCAICGLPGTKDNPLSVAHNIPYQNGRRWFGLTPDALNRKENVCWAHIKVCNKKAELNLSQSIKFLQSSKGFGYKGPLPSYVPNSVKQLWETGEMSFWPPEPKRKYNTGFDGRTFLTKEEWQTFCRWVPHRVIKLVVDGECVCCSSTNADQDEHQKAHLIGHSNGIKWFGLTPDWLGGYYNIVPACRTRKGGKRCNKLVELSQEDSIIFLKRLGITELPPYLPKETIELWKRISSSQKTSSHILDKIINRLTSKR